jgi:small-conductance mechanosensitive channel
MEQAERSIARRSATTYSAISLTVAIIFLIAATVTGYDAVARFGGAIWVFMLSMIVTMPVVTSRFKRGRS